jgi:hypothetical protein
LRIEDGGLKIEDCGSRIRLRSRPQDHAVGLVHAHFVDHYSDCWLK